MELLLIIKILQYILNKIIIILKIYKIIKLSYSKGL